MHDCRGNALVVEQVRILVLAREHQRRDKGQNHQDPGHPEGVRERGRGVGQSARDELRCDAELRERLGLDVGQDRRVGLGDAASRPGICSVPGMTGESLRWLVSSTDIVAIPIELAICCVMFSKVEPRATAWAASVLRAEVNNGIIVAPMPMPITTSIGMSTE